MKAIASRFPDAQKTFSLAALAQVIRQNALRRPLCKVITAECFLDLTHDQVMARIQNGNFPWAFNIGAGKLRSEPRILALTVVEKIFGVHPAIGATKDLRLKEVIDIILPARDIRSTELQRFLSCESGQIRILRSQFRVTRAAKATDGPNSFTVFSRASVAAWLAKRRMA